MENLNGTLTAYCVDTLMLCRLAGTDRARGALLQGMDLTERVDACGARPGVPAAAVQMQLWRIRGGS